MARETQHREMPEYGNRGGRAINEISENCSWGDMPPVLEPTKPAGTPPSQGGDRGEGRGRR